MAIGATTNWYVRAAGAETNGGGFDGTTYPSGTNFCDQDAAKVTFSSGNANQLSAAQNSTTVTSAGTPFLATMVGNCIRISGGTNWVTGYYFVATFVSTSSITVDRAPCTAGAGSVGNGALGGAHATLNSYSNGGGNTAPLVTTPLAAGHTVNIRGGGTNDPAVGTYDYAPASNWLFPSGDNVSGPITFIGYNGRPSFSYNGGGITAGTGYIFKNLKAVLISVTGGTGGFLAHIANLTFVDSIIDQNGFDATLMTMDGGTIRNVEFRNSGSKTVGTLPGINQSGNSYGGSLEGCYIHDLRFNAISMDNEYCLNVFNCIIANCTGAGIVLLGAGGARTGLIRGNTIDGNTGAGISVTTSAALRTYSALNNILSNNGTYGLDITVNTATLNDRLKALSWDFNDYFGNTTAAYHNISAGANDLALDPQFVNRTGLNYAIGSNLAVKGFPGQFPYLNVSTSMYAIGALQPGGSPFSPLRSPTVMVS